MKTFHGAAELLWCWADFKQESKLICENAGKQHIHEQRRNRNENLSF